MNMHQTVAADDWATLLAAYRAALEVENAYDAEHCHVPADLPVGPERGAIIQAIPDENWK